MPSPGADRRHRPPQGPETPHRVVRRVQFDRTAIQRRQAVGRMPAAFFGHGSPMNALERNRYTEAWSAFGEAVPRPRAILAVSAHWYVTGTRVTVNDQPPTIHDFGGFPRELFAFEYPAPGSPALAQRVHDLLAPVSVQLDDRWGLDHGTWSVLTHVFPHADVPVVQISVDRAQPPAYHYELAKRLGPMRDEGVLVIASGNVVHNLEILRSGWKGAAPGWAARFSAEVLARIQRRDHASLIDYRSLGPEAQLAIPTPEHFLPLLYAIALQRDDDAIVPIVDGAAYEALDMLSFAVA